MCFPPSPLHHSCPRHYHFLLRPAADVTDNSLSPPNWSASNLEYLTIHFPHHSQRELLQTVSRLFNTLHRFPLLFKLNLNSLQWSPTLHLIGPSSTYPVYLVIMLRPHLAFSVSQAHPHYKIFVLDIHYAWISCLQFWFIFFLSLSLLLKCHLLIFSSDYLL